MKHIKTIAALGLIAGPLGVSGHAQSAEVAHPQPDEAKSAKAIADTHYTSIYGPAAKLASENPVLIAQSPTPPPPPPPPPHAQSVSSRAHNHGKTTVSPAVRARYSIPPSSGESA